MVPYKRPYPLMICQDDDLLLSITEFDYDLTVDDFVRYFENRTGYLMKSTCVRHGRTVKPGWGLNLDIFGNPKTKLEIEDIRKKVLRHLGPGFAKNLTDIKYLEITKGKLQDCWEIWREGKGPGIWNRKGVL